MSRVERIKELHARALELEPEQRPAFLARECGADEELRAEVESLLAAFDAMGGFLETSAGDRLVGPEPVFQKGDHVGSYEIVRVLGAGGAGTVYEAMQARPHRRVALKVVRPAEAKRFEEEAELLARVTHPAIAQIYEAGVHEGIPYSAMEYVQGAQSLTSYARGLPTRNRLELLAQVADAIQHGHDQGIVHRDIKPGNLLVDTQGQPKIIDFGIAQIEGPAREIAGTAHYMSPEQRVPGDIDARTDVYALGVVLDELLPDRRSRELVAIVNKARAEDRAQRYPSAVAVADDLRRYLRQRPVAAVGGGPVYRARKFFWRHRAAVAFVGMIGVAAAAAVLRRRPPDGIDLDTRRAELRALIPRLAAATDALLANDRDKARAHLAQVLPAMRAWEWHHLQGRLDLSTRAIAWPGHVMGGIAALSPDGRLGAAPAYRASSSQRATRLWDLDTGAVAWTISTGARTVYSLAFRADATAIAFGYYAGRIEIRDVATGDLRLDFAAHDGNVTQMLFEDDVLITASADGTIKFWSPETGELRRTLRGHEDRVVCLARHGERLASGGRDGAIRICNLASDEPPLVIRRHGESVAGVAFSPDGERIASASWDHRVRLWNLAKREMIASHASHRDVSRSVRFSPDGRTFASASYDGTVRLWHGVRGHEITCFRGDTGMIHTVFYRPGRDELVSFGSKGVHFWDLEERDGGATLHGHTGPVHALAFSADGRRLASASRGGTVKVWDVEALTELASLRPGDAPRHVAFGAAGGNVYCAGDTRVSVWSWPSGEVRRLTDGSGAFLPVTGESAYEATPTGLRLRDFVSGRTVATATFPDGASVIACDPTGTKIATGSHTGSVHLWQARTLARVAVRNRQGPPIRHIALGPGGRRVAVLWRDGTLRILDGRNLEPVSSPEGHASPALWIALSPDGTRLASCGPEGRVHLWDVETGTRVYTLQHDQPVRRVEFSPDGRTLAASSGTEGEPSVIRLWQAR